LGYVVFFDTHLDQNAIHLVRRTGSAFHYFDALFAGDFAFFVKHVDNCFAASRWCRLGVGKRHEILFELL
jgi:hypothetical protein